MTSKEIKSYRENAEIYRGQEECKSKILDLLIDLHLPLGLLPMENIEEFGFDRSSRFMWVTQKRKKVHTFKSIKQQVSYGAEISGFVEDRRIWKLVGVKTKEFFVWLTITDVFVDEDDEEITFVTGSGLSESFPVEAFDLEE